MAFMRRPCASLPAADRARRPVRTRRRPAAAAALIVAVLAVLGASGQASAAAPAIEVHVTGCADVDGREVERLLAIELAFVGAQHGSPGPIAVALTCAGPRLQMTAQDPILNRRLGREVILGPPEAGRDRTIALQAAATTSTALPPITPAPPFIVSGGEPRPPAPRFELRVQSGVRLRDWSSPLLAGQVSLGATFPLGRARALAELDFEHGSTERTAGEVSWSIAAAGLGAGWRSRRHGVVALDGSALLALGFADVRGAAGSAAIAGSTVTGVVGQAALGAGPVFFWGGARLALRVELGATFPTATARVSGERDVALGGLWAGAGLSVGGGWTAR
jgi:hypothetical protein